MLDSDCPADCSDCGCCGRELSLATHPHPPPTHPHPLSHSDPLPHPPVPAVPHFASLSLSLVFLLLLVLIPQYRILGECARRMRGWKGGRGGPWRWQLLAGAHTRQPRPRCHSVIKIVCATPCTVYLCLNVAARVLPGHVHAPVIAWTSLRVHVRVSCVCIDSTRLYTSPPALFYSLMTPRVYIRYTQEVSLLEDRGVRYAANLRAQVDR